ncbi:leucine-rich repeat receptor-like protein kinase family protein [Artemisia annua]|uniref:Leucine-rich repeat receptor-like protein kinase family protein n=1 Tax=Artemisia annua TaxID=35608 RepID=A0A2U1LNF5_ARTAN|nr:leucine-rich repeat receptor-like protein kinase family protein [Artemisia annua]
MASSKFLLLSLALLLVALSFTLNFTSASLEEAEALQKWKASLKIPNNSQIVSSWTPLARNTSAPALCRSWYGIACNADGNINMLNLSTSELKGTLHQFPFSILGNLTHFELSVNNFFGPIPPEIGLLTKLVYLNFSTNQFSGVIPPTIADGKWQGNWNADYNFTLRDLQLDDLVELAIQTMHESWCL